MEKINNKIIIFKYEYWHTKNFIKYVHGGIELLFVHIVVNETAPMISWIFYFDKCLLLIVKKYKYK